MRQWVSSMASRKGGLCWTLAALLCTAGIWAFKRSIAAYTQQLCRISFVQFGANLRLLLEEPAIGSFRFQILHTTAMNLRKRPKENVKVFDPPTQ